MITIVHYMLYFSIRARADRENPEELPRIAELQKDLDTLKAETRQRLNAAVDSKYQAGLAYVFCHLIEKKLLTMFGNWTAVMCSSITSCVEHVMPHYGHL